MDKCVDAEAFGICFHLKDVCARFPKNMRFNSCFANLHKRSVNIFYVGLMLVTAFPSVPYEVQLYGCNDAASDGRTYFMDDGRFSDNLKMVIDDLLLYTPQTGFNTSSYGHTPDKVYGLLQCISNMPKQECALCSQEANNKFQELCGNVTGGTVWMDRCFLRFENFSFFSKLDTDGDYIVTKNITVDVPAFKNTISYLISNLSEKAYVKGFAAGSSNYSSTSQVYGLVQCWRDISAKDCRTCLSLAMEILEPCCSTKQGAQVLLKSCTVRYEIYPFFEIRMSSSGQGSPPIWRESSDGASSKESSKNIGVVFGLVGGLILLSLVCLFRMRSKVASALSLRPETQNEEREIYEETPHLGLTMMEESFIFRLEVLKEATRNFHENNKLGEGGFGTVYKGTTADGKEIAVKVLSAKSRQGKREFKNEVKLLANVQHQNIVNLLGCCVDGKKRFLVYDYLPNKSLDFFLFNSDTEERRKLDWQQRYNIITGIAHGLLYLHEHSPVRIIHRDIKASNILLDENLTPKIADFGFAILFPEDKISVQTRVAGTYGYMAPEYAMGGNLSVKADVYSFGVLILEIVSGRKQTDKNLHWNMHSLLERAWRQMYDGGDILNMVDYVLTEYCFEEEVQQQVLTCIQVGLLCIQTDASIRPTMTNITCMIFTSSELRRRPIYTVQIESPRNEC